MKEDHVRLLVAGMVVGGFYVFLWKILSDAVHLRDPETAKLVGVIFGWFAAAMTPIITSFFRPKA